MDRPFFIALDFDEQAKRQRFLKSFAAETLDVKIGMELFYREGLPVVHELKEAGYRLFLDLKLHDIPNTVGRTMRALAELDVDVVNVHAAGGKAMMEAALEGLEAGTRAGKQRPKLIAVTQLTSTDSRMLNEELLIDKAMDEVVVRYAQLAQESGLDGVVCSAREVPLIQAACSNRFLTVTPGIRRQDDQVGDQVRVVTPGEAKALGSWAIVVGRSITAAADPLAVYREMNQDWKGAPEH
ncbi:orotidine-5'-phosphate decarboxylase [Shouchella clausii]|uniref:Orotidine 5'-phosphate decarboxylase n=1 Tax=Shouchella clausii TaxID=79880 RepID=A0A268S3M4_SHOCL|nr:orotidine-5'-phosphate decarboxylase [Shouchella clausii]PAD44570.1 orotidine-5'-phosphate decarboxylase [Bacillus sp. 7520-S]SPU22095.1 orotidine 5'-phosphate decarboxylase [Niallia circulans]AST97444.1 orotidine 5'-phosphate decarboxylase [Shouchella clausii]MBU8596542.1 orotidine-5'-phosphate decarboxylase [Shouchella clausii]MCM3547102.1 orotidine-5'-phosphate decarboxylase [Shouchella clausii]